MSGYVLNRRQVHMIVLSFIATSTGLIPDTATANQFDTAADLAIHKHKETDKIKLEGEHWHIKPVKIVRDKRNGASLWVVSGQLSHRLTGAPDDQYYFYAKIDASGLVDFSDKSKRGGLLSVILGPSGIRMLDEPIISSIIGRTLEGTWEGKARRIALRLVAKVMEYYDEEGR